MNLPTITDIEYAAPLGQEHRDVMLDLILAWASLDGALGLLLAKVTDLTPSDCAFLVEKDGTGTKFNEIAKALRQEPRGGPAASKIRRYKKRYEKHSVLRNHVAHSRCVGCLAADPAYLIFLKFERFDEGSLRVDLVPLEDLRHATVWGNALHELVMRLVDN